MEEGSGMSGRSVIVFPRHGRISGHSRLPIYHATVKTWMPRHRRAEATPSFGRLYPGITNGLMRAAHDTGAFCSGHQPAAMSKFASHGGGSPHDDYRFPGPCL